MAASPITSDADLVSLIITSNGSPIKDTYQVVSACVDRSVNEIPSCKIEISDGSAAKEDFPISDSDTFVPGTEIEVLAGYEGKTTSIFKGIIINHGLQITSDNGSLLTVFCKDEAVKMAVGRKNAYYKETTDSGIISKLISDNGLSADVVSTSNELREVIQYYSTDWDFMLTRADINGLVTIVNDGTVSIQNPEDSTDVVLGLTYGNDMLEFKAEIDAQTQYSSVTSSSWDVKNQAIASGNATPGNQPIGNLATSTLAEVIGLSTYGLQSAGPLESDMLTTWSKAQAMKSAYAKIRGTVKFQGNASALPGTLIGLKGVGERFSGNAYVSGIRHDIKDGNWVTTAQMGLSPDWFASQVKTEAPLAAGLLPGIEGLQIGKVKQINDDPENGFRVLITLPLIQSGDDGVWARLATFYATAGAGAFFFPEVDDEVVVGFLNDDPRYPVILGSVYSSGRVAHDTPDENNNLKAFVSREKMKITFDEENKVISIMTPKSNQLVFSDEDESITLTDQNNNFIKLSSEGIEINSASNVRITAAESVTIDGPGGIIETASGGTISLSAMTISCNADTEFTASADASASLSSSGELAITGSMVLINS